MQRGVITTNSQQWESRGTRALQHGTYEIFCRTTYAATSFSKVSTSAGTGATSGGTIGALIGEGVGAIPGAVAGGVIGGVWGLVDNTQDSIGWRIVVNCTACGETFSIEHTTSGNSNTDHFQSSRCHCGGCRLDIEIIPTSWFRGEI